MAYDAAGNRVSSTTADGTSTLSYDGLGRTTGEATPNGNLTTHVYDGLGREIETAVDAGIGTTITTRVFDRLGRLLTETVDDGGLALTTARSYDLMGRELQVTDPGGLATTTSHDRLGRPVRIVGASTVVDLAYDKLGNQLTQTGPYSADDPAAPVNKTTYDALDRSLTQVANFVAGSSDPADNLTIRTTYDAAGRVIAVRDPKGTVVRTVVNARGLASRTIEHCTDSGSTPTVDPANCTGGGTHDSDTNLVTDLAYDGSGALRTTVRQESVAGVLTERTRDAAGRIVKVVLDKGSGRLNLTTEFAYDDLGREIARRDPGGTVGRSFYDAEGRLISTLGNCTSSGQTLPTTDWATCSGAGTHDATWNVMTAYAYDPRGNKISEVAANGRETRFGYDGADRLMWQVENYVDSPSSPAPADVNVTTYFYYDADGRQVAVKAPTVDRETFTVTRNFYDALGRVTKEVRNCTSIGTDIPADPAACTGLGTSNASTNVTAVYLYDAEGRRIAMTEPSPALTVPGAATLSTRYAFDGGGRLCRVLENAGIDLQSLTDPCSTGVTGTDSSNVSTRYTYDANGQLTSMVDGEGNTTGYTYDRAGRMIGRSDSNGATVAWRYDERGNRVAQTNRADTSPTSPTVTWTYDGADRMVSRLADGETITFAYDANGNRISAYGPEGEITSTFDRLNRPLTVLAEDGSSTTYAYDFNAPERGDPSGTYAINLDAFGREIGLTDPLHPGAPFATTYRADGQEDTRSDPNGNLTAFGYDPLGQVTLKATNGSGGAPSRAVYTYAYNQAGLRVTETSTVSGDPTNGNVAYTYDPLGRLAGYARDGAVPAAYGWGAVPNRERVQAGSDPVVTTAFDDANRPTTDSAGGTYSHDLDGQLTALPGQRLEWDSLGG